MRLTLKSLFFIKNINFLISFRPPNILSGPIDDERQSTGRVMSTKPNV